MIKTWKLHLNLFQGAPQNGTDITLWNPSKMKMNEGWQLVPSANESGPVKFQMGFNSLPGQTKKNFQKLKKCSISEIKHTRPSYGLPLENGWFEKNKNGESRSAIGQAWPWALLSLGCIWVCFLVWGLRGGPIFWPNNLMGLDWAYIFLKMRPGPACLAQGLYQYESVERFTSWIVNLRKCIKQDL